MVAKANKATGTLTLQVADGQIVELAVPETMLEHLLAGEQVEITVRKGSSLATDRSRTSMPRSAWDD